MLDRLIELVLFALPMVAVLSITAVAIWLAWWLLLRRAPMMGYESRRTRQLTFMGVVAVCIVLMIVMLPVPTSTRDQLLAVFGLVTTAVIGLSSTTFVAHAMAGFMLRSTKSFSIGDFLRSDQHFGRVTERGLLHTEIQTEDRDLTTLPNLFLITHPYTVVRSSGTIVSAEVGLGYGVHHAVIEPLLLSAAKQVGLDDPYVRVMKLGDFAVTYRVSGLLTETQQLITTRSLLNSAVLDTLHGQGIEIMSPTFMVQRPQPDAPSEVPVSVRKKDRQERKSTAEAVAFDKAEAAAEKEQAVAALTELIQQREAELKSADADDKPRLTEELEKLKQQAELLIQKPDDDSDKPS